MDADNIANAYSDKYFYSDKDSDKYHDSNKDTNMVANKHTYVYKNADKIADTLSDTDLYADKDTNMVANKHEYPYKYTNSDTSTATTRYTGRGFDSSGLLRYNPRGYQNIQQNSHSSKCRHSYWKRYSEC